ncbi:MAG: PTPA-CTERM sorting domain-containing protein [Nodularia sp. (in: Bacteria)]|nr:MAG: PTPA-CTERM sorting domain-containing protein [Nodularia sp. (in: cyanobacteria)]
MFPQNTLNRSLLVLAATASVCCGNLLLAKPSYASGFTGDYAPDKWDLTSTNALGAVTVVEPIIDGITISSAPLPNLLGSSTNTTRYTTQFQGNGNDGTVSFNWTYTPLLGDNLFGFEIGGTFFELYSQNVLVSPDILPIPVSFSGNVSDQQDIAFVITNTTDGITTTPAIANITNFNASINDGDPVIPTPAMLPGLVGMWMAAMRKKRQQQMKKE